MIWQRGTEAPMDTSPPGPRQPSIFDTDAAQGWSGQPCNPALAIDTDMTDVEMSSLTPPSHKNVDTRRHLASASEALADDSMTDADMMSGTRTDKASRSDGAAHNSPLASTSQHVRRKRSVLSRKGKRLAHLQSRELVPSSRVSNAQALDDDSFGTEDEEHDDDDDDDDDEDNDDEAEGASGDGSKRARQRSTPSRIRSITRYAVNYVLPNAVSPLPYAPAGSVHHMDKPELLLGYAQLIFNASILSAFLYLLFHIVRTVQTDVAEKVRAYEMDTLAEVTACAAAYTANRCGTDLQAPALAHACTNWERCSGRDPAVVGTARVTAETFAEILNGFVDSVSWKTMLFTLICFSMVVGATNSFLSFFRIKSRSRSQNDPGPRASQPPQTHAIASAPQQPGGLYAANTPHYYHSPHPDYGAVPPYGYSNWQQLPPSTPSRRRTRPAA